jgi:hypothetical protein
VESSGDGSGGELPFNNGSGDEERTGGGLGGQEVGSGGTIKEIFMEAGVLHFWRQAKATASDQRSQLINLFWRRLFLPALVNRLMEAVALSCLPPLINLNK